MYKNKLTDKEKLILNYIVNYFISTGNPVGSNTLLERYDIQWSSATVRNIMSKLIEYGYLSQPHISAGRIPTDLGIRLYIDSLTYSYELSEDKIGFINKRYENVDKTIDKLLVETSSVLSDISSFAGLATLPNSKYYKIKSAKLVKLDYKKVLFILIFNGGLTEKTLIALKKDIPSDLLDKISLYLNMISENLTLEDLKTTVLSEIKFKQDEIFKEIKKSIVKLSAGSSDSDDDSGLYIKGHSSLIDKLNFSSTEDLIDLLKAFEEKRYIIEILNNVKNGDGIRVFFGSDQGMMNGYSIVACSYGRDNNMGSIGVFGPLRMDYSQIIPLVDYTAHIVSDIVNNGGFYDGRRQ